MAKNLIYKRTTVDQLTIKGILSDDCTTITVEDGEETKQVKISEYLKDFAGTHIEFVAKTKIENDLTEE